MTKELRARQAYHMDHSTDTRYRAAQLGAILARHYPDAPTHLVARVVYDLQAHARKAKSFSLKMCNDPLTEEQTLRMEKWMDDASAKFSRIFAHWRLIDEPGENPCTAPALAYFGGDPRGPCASLHIPGQRGDGFGDGFAIY